MGISCVILFACSPGNEESGVGATTEQVSVSDNMAQAAALPPFHMEDVKGNVVQLQSLKGKKVFVNLWASWCPPCKREMPSIEKLYQTVDTSKVAFVLLSLDDQFEKAIRYSDKRNLSLPIYHPAENLPSLFNVQGIPATFIFNEAGVLIRQIEGGEDFNTKQYHDLLQ